MERIFRFYFLAFYFGIKRDKTFSRVGRVKFLIEMELAQIYGSALFVLCGFIEIKQYASFIGLILGAIVIFLAYITCKYYVRRNEEKILKDIKKYSLKRRKIYAVVGYATIVVVLLLTLYCGLLGGFIHNYYYPM